MLGSNGFSGVLGGHIGPRASELLDGRLTPEAEHDARVHLGRCRQCAVLVAAEQDARTALRSVAMPTGLSSSAPSPTLVAGLLAMSSPDPRAVPGAQMIALAAPTTTPAGPDPAGSLAPTRRLQPRLRGVLVVSTLVASTVTATVVVTSSAPTVRRQAGSVAQRSVPGDLVSGPRAFTHPANMSVALPTESAR